MNYLPPAYRSDPTNPKSHNPKSHLKRIAGSPMVALCAEAWLGGPPTH